MNNIPDAYEVIKEEPIDDIRSKGILLRHKKSGARIAVVENEDPNKVFYIGFRTPVSDSTGVPHIIEHSVLCGSKKYPVKDPFIELAKGSINTFLNAMTYPDKTVYPVASTNGKDFKNLMDVYMDAVLHPSIYEHSEIFSQEGWHYEMEDEDNDLSINGVVYNEMKGAFSNPDDVFSREIMSSLFPDTTYHFESGGDPSVIPSLSYEDFLDFHRRYYHPVNSYIYLYGDLDMEERLLYLDREYLSKYERIELDSTVAVQSPFTKINKVEKEYPIESGSDTKEKTYISLNKVIGEGDTLFHTAFEILDQVLLNSPAAPLRIALSKAGIATDIMGGFDTSTLQPTFTIELKGSDEKHLDKFLSIVKDVLTEQVEKGIDKKALQGALNVSEFRFREADFGSYPKGLVYGLSMLDTWLYDDMRPFDLLHGVETFRALREKLDSGYFEEITKKYLLENLHGSILILKPKPGLSAEREKDLAKKMEEKKASLSRDELHTLCGNTKKLKEYQSTPDTEEALQTIPMLDRKDLQREIRPYKNKESEEHGIKVVSHDFVTNGIHYLEMMFDITDMKAEALPLVSFFSKALALVDTKDRGYADLANEIYLHTGGIASDTSSVMSFKENESKLYFVVRGKFFYEESKNAFSLLREIMERSDFSDTGRLEELLKQDYAVFQERFLTAGHSAAVSRVSSYYSKRGLKAELLGGVDYYNFVKETLSDYKNKKEALSKGLESLKKEIFRKDNIIISSTMEEGNDDGLSAFLEDLSNFLSDEKPDGTKEELVPTRKNEGLSTAASVQYVARGGNFLRDGGKYTGAFEVLRTILSLDYFWQNLRVLGGAYGCMSSFARSGEMHFVSYRDPHLQRTNGIFEKTSEFLESFDVSERDMTKFVIGTIGNIDVPKTPLADGRRSMTHFLSGLSDEEVQKTRDEILDAKPSDIRALAPLIRKVMDQDYLCVIGNEEKIKKEEKLFMKVEALL